MVLLHRQKQHLVRREAVHTKLEGWTGARWGPLVPSGFCPHSSLLGKGSEQKATELVTKTQRTRDFAETEMGRKMELEMQSKKR